MARAMKRQASMEPDNRPPFGSKVFVAAHLRRGHGRGPHGGYRTLSDGHHVGGATRGLEGYVRGYSVKCALVVYGLNENPVRVPLDAVTPVAGCIDLGGGLEAHFESSRLTAVTQPGGLAKLVVKADG